jgi:hypothetical protein
MSDAERTTRKLRELIQDTGLTRAEVVVKAYELGMKDAEDILRETLIKARAMTPENERN